MPDDAGEGVVGGIVMSQRLLGDGCHQLQGRFRGHDQTDQRPKIIKSSVPHFMPRGEPGSDWEWFLWSDLVDVSEKKQ